MTLIAPTLQAFFTDRLTEQLHASPRTIASYRDSLRLLLCFANGRTGIAPSALGWDDLDEPLISAFLEHLETDRHNSARARNLRLTAIRALFRYAALRHPEHAAVIARELSIPAKRFDRRIVTFFTSEESLPITRRQAHSPTRAPPQLRNVAAPGLASTAPSSPSGSDMPTPAPPSDTATPT
jgi:site-specific recombinase XerD